jgi:hypothetical protein
MTYVPNAKRYAGTPVSGSGRAAASRIASFALSQLVSLLCVPALRAIPTNQSADASPLPDDPQSPTLIPHPVPNSGCEDTVVGVSRIVSSAPGSAASSRLNWYERFAKGPQAQSLTPRHEAWLASRNVVDPFNRIAITGEVGISVAADGHSPYGPGLPGCGLTLGVSLTEDLTGEFFDTFLIPVPRQDPRYYRMDHATIHPRIGHAIVQVLWTRGDNGMGMRNYANLAGFASDHAIAKIHPGPRFLFRRHGRPLRRSPCLRPHRQLCQRVPPRSSQPRPRPDRDHPADHQSGRQHGAWEKPAAIGWSLRVNCALTIYNVEQI